MYHPDVTAAAIAAESTRLGWPLRYYTRSQIDAAIAHLAAIYDPEKEKLTRPLTGDESRFITNERKLCQLDFRYWLTTYAWIVDFYKRPTRFIPNVAQTIILDLWATDELAGHAIWMQQLKARRLGVSTLSELNVQHRFQFHPYSACLIASADPSKTINMAGMIKFSLEQQPWWLLPTATKIKHGMPAEFGEIETTLSIESGNQFTGVGRGASPNVIHLSELCEYQDADDIISGGLMKAVIDTPNTFGILESTALGRGNWWHKQWEQNKRDWARGTARVRPVFLPWYVGTDLYPSAADRRKRPVPDAWIPSDRTIKYAEKARAYVTTNQLLFAYLAHGDASWTLPREQMYWHEIEYNTAKENGELHIFLSELPADDFEAFQTNAVSIIDPEIIIGYRERTRQPLGVYTIIGPDIPPLMTAPVRQWDTSKPTITIPTRDFTPNYDVKYQLVPLTFAGYDALDEQLKLLIWEHPAYPFVYGVGVDCAEGVGQDNAVMEVLREATPEREPGQVAEWVSNTTTAFQLWPLILALGCYYSQPTHPQYNDRRQCRLAIETWTNGAAAQHELQKRGWSNFHPMFVAGDSRVMKTAGNASRIGVMTNAPLRAAMQDMWMTSLKEESIDIPSPYLVEEIATLENVNGKAQAVLGEHDDRWMAKGIVLYSLHVNKPWKKQYARKRIDYAPGLSADSPIAHPIWQPGSQASSQPFGPRHPQQPVTQRLFKETRYGRLQRAINSRMPKGFR